MELLEDGWTTLFDYRENRHRNGIPEGPKTRLLKRLEDILDALYADGMVHGDFRMANVMVKLDEEEKAVLIDFDWAGEAESVKYPSLAAMALATLESQEGPLARGMIVGFMKRGRMKCDQLVYRLIVYHYC